MARPHKLNPSLVEEASDWFIEFNSGSIDAAGRDQFDAWLRRSPEHVQAYLKIAMLWEEAPLLGKTPVLASDELVARVLAEGNIVPFEKPQPGPEQTATSLDVATSHPPPRPHAQSSIPSPEGGTPPPESRGASRIRGFAIAASLAIATVATGTWFYVQRDTYTAAVGEQRSVRLEDGSTVDLNSQSSVRVRFSAHRRSIELLKGQALFRVTKDSTRPFIVTTNDTQVRAVGTQFDVYRKSSGTVVTVLEGRVAVEPEGSPSSEAENPPVALPANRSLEGQTETTPKDTHSTSSSRAGSATPEPPPPTVLTPLEGEILLAAGEQVTVTQTSISPPHEADLSLATAWTQRKIVFQAAPLSEVADEFNRYNTRKLLIVDPDLKATRISGVFSSTDPDSLLRFLRALPNIVVDESGSNIRIARK